MAGIDWFRWHHGSVTDPKFQLVARKSGASLPDVIAVWAYLLEKASAADFRGCFGEIDCEAVDCLFGLDDGTTDAILSQMVERKLIADEFIVAWEKRQPKRERTDDLSTDRVKAFREKKRHETPLKEDETPRNAEQRQETPRGEESREELTTDTDVSVVGSESLPTCPHKEIISIYGEVLPELAQPRVWEGARQSNLAARWKWVLADLKKKGKPFDRDAGLSFFRRMFEYIHGIDFLMGRTSSWGGCDLGWIVKAENFAKIIEGKYENREAA